MQDPSHRLATLLQAAHVSLEGVDDTLARSDRLRGWAEALRARLRRKARLRRRILGLHLLRFWRRVRWWLLLLLVVAGLILLLVHYWPWISLQLSNMRGPVLQPSVTPDFIGPRPPASGAGP